MKRLITVCIFIAATMNAHAMITETGTLRGFLLGSCPTCGYDNWNSHVVEGLVAPGFNNYGPPWFDPQTNGFGNFTLIPTGTAGNLTLTNWRSVFAACIRGQWSSADAILSANAPSWNYELVEFLDTELSQTFYIVRERLDSSYIDINVVEEPGDDVIGSFRNGWGVYVFNPSATIPQAIVQMPHPEGDYFAVPACIELFLRSGLRSLMIAGACRETRWTNNGSFNNEKSLSDPSRNGRTPFNECHRAIVSYLDGNRLSPFVAIQLHAYMPDLSANEPAIQVSAIDDGKPNPPLRDRVEHLDFINFLGRYPVQGIPADPSITVGIEDYVSLLSTPAHYFYGADDSIRIPNSPDLPGYSDNQQMLISHAVHNRDVDPENFVHVEFNKYPDELWTSYNPSDEDWHRWLPGPMPATLETYREFLAFHAAFFTSMDAALRHTVLDPDVTPPQIVSLSGIEHQANGNTLLRWNPAAVDRFFDSYIVYYDTDGITAGSPYFSRTTAGQGALVDYATTSCVIPPLPEPVWRYQFAVSSRDYAGNIAPLSNLMPEQLIAVVFPFSEADLGDLNECNYYTADAYPSHGLSGIAWLGATVTGEAEPDQNDADDGVDFPMRPWPPCSEIPLRVTVTGGPRYADYSSLGGRLFLNAWKDGNNNGDFCDDVCEEMVSEWVIQDREVTPGTIPIVITNAGEFSGVGIEDVFRFRLTSQPVGRWGYSLTDNDLCPNNNCDGTFGADHLGEVEDYYFTDEVLPVELASFEAVPGNGSVSLRWLTASETDNDYFVLERNGLVVSQIPTSGNGSSGHTYRFEDDGLTNLATYHYSLFTVDLSGVRVRVATASAVPLQNAAEVMKYALRQNYPNPFNPITQIHFELAESGFVTLKVYNAAGQAVSTLVHGHMSAGAQTVTFDAHGLPSGVYLCQLKAGSFSAVQKLILMK